MSNSLSERVYEASVPYLGPAAMVFLKRQTATHMGGLNFEQITLTDLPELLGWILISGRLLIGPKADDLVGKLQNEFNVRLQ
ncbi:MAG: hypothetical protein HGA76_00250 [Candidatus Firestonebacteria bacterium]|nr:hypothetical protein [Candidatus Firestonebacteria bacterium]